jgi:hypothetical protein
VHQKISGMIEHEYIMHWNGAKEKKQRVRMGQSRKKNVLIQKVDEKGKNGDWKSTMQQSIYGTTYKSRKHEQEDSF